MTAFLVSYSLLGRTVQPTSTLHCPLRHRVNIITCNLKEPRLCADYLHDSR